MLELDSTEITCSPVGELESRSAADGHQTTHCLGLTATRSRSGIAAWHWPRRSTTCQARRSSGEPGPAAPMADTAIWSTFSWPRANILSARALSLVLVWLVLAFGLCFACSCDQNVRACLLVSSRRYFYKVPACGANNPTPSGPPSPPSNPSPTISKLARLPQSASSGRSSCDRASSATSSPGASAICSGGIESTPRTVERQLVVGLVVAEQRRQVGVEAHSPAKRVRERQSAGQRVGQQG